MAALRIPVKWTQERKCICQTEGSALCVTTTKERVRMEENTSKTLIVKRNNSAGVGKTAVSWLLCGGSRWKSPLLALCVCLDESLRLCLESASSFSKQESGQTSFISRILDPTTANERNSDQWGEQRTHLAVLMCFSCSQWGTMARMVMALQLMA